MKITKMSTDLPPDYHLVLVSDTLFPLFTPGTITRTVFGEKMRHGVVYFCAESSGNDWMGFYTFILHGHRYEVAEVSLSMFDRYRYAEYIASGANILQAFELLAL